MSEELENKETPEATDTIGAGEGDTGEPEQSPALDVEDTLGGNVKDSVAKLKGKSPEDLQALLEAEQAGNKRTGVTSAIEALLNPEPKDTGAGKPDAKRTAKVIQAELEAAEDGPTDIENAKLIQALRAELEEAK